VATNWVQTVDASYHGDVWPLIPDGGSTNAVFRRVGLFHLSSNAYALEMSSRSTLSDATNISSSLLVVVVHPSFFVSFIELTKYCVPCEL
jgi:hypothetical protein